MDKPNRPHLHQSTTTPLTHQAARRDLPNGSHRSHCQDRTARIASSLLDETLGKINDDRTGLHVHSWNQWNDEGDFSAFAGNRLEDETVLCGTDGDIRHTTDHLTVDVDHVASDEILDPPLVTVEVAALVSLDDELRADERFSVFTRVDTSEMEEVVGTVHPLRDHPQRPAGRLSRRKIATYCEPVVRVRHEAANDDIPVDPVRSAHISHGDVLLTWIGHVTTAASVEEVDVY